MNSLDFALFGLYPYICLAVFLLGSLLLAVLTAILGAVLTLLLLQLGKLIRPH